MIVKNLIFSIVLAVLIIACANDESKTSTIEVRQVCELFKKDIIGIHSLETDLTNLDTDDDGSSLLAKKIKGEWLDDYGNGDDSWCFYSTTVTQEGANFTPERIRMVFRTETQSGVASKNCKKSEYCYRRNDKQHVLLWANSTKQSSAADAQQFFYKSPVAEH